MLNDFLYLWRNRECPVLFSRWAKVWCKRAFHIIGILRLLARSMLFRLRGASIGRLVVLGNVEASGNFANLSVGDETALGKCVVALHDQVTIGKRVVINDGCILLTASHLMIDPTWAQKKAPIVIGDYAWIATNAILLPGVTVGRGSVIGAGAVVRGDVPDYGVVLGNPAQLASKQRASNLAYSPVMLCAAFEAWVGPTFNEHQKENIFWRQ